MYLPKDFTNYIYVDIETDDINATRIWCAVFIIIATGQVVKCVGHQEIKRFIDEAPKESRWVGHNAISFDVPQLNRLLGCSMSLSRVVDTLVLSYLFNPKLPGGHSLEAYGDRLKHPKLHVDIGFDKFTPELLERCVGDCLLGVKVFKALVDKMTRIGYSEKSCALEHRIRSIVDRQQEYGWFFDTVAAKDLYERLRRSEEQLGVSIKELFGRTLKSQGTYTYRTRADGSPYASYERHLDTYDKLTHRSDGTYEVFSYEDFNIGSPVQRLARLEGLGYRPVKLTKGGNPSVDEESLVEFANSSGIKEVQAIADWLVINGRANMINTWLNNVGPDSRIHGRVFTCGAGSRRMTHSAPNTANIPGNGAKYGEECRSLWTVADRDRQCIVGHDAKAAQMRMFGHYLNDPATARLYIEGDPHQHNADAVGIERRLVKNVFYAMIFGAYDPKLASTAGFTSNLKAEGARIREALYKTTPGLERLTKEIGYEFKAQHGRLKCIDGGYVLCPNESAALNYKIQSAEACLMKQATIFIDERAQHLDHHKIGDIHDEGQDECVKEDAEELGKIKVQAIRDAGEELRFTVPMDGDYKIGSDWSMTH